jgi:hypothetical protein
MLKMVFDQMTSRAEVTMCKDHASSTVGQWTKFVVVAFSTLLDGLAPILTTFLLKMQKSRKSAHPTVHDKNADDLQK